MLGFTINVSDIIPVVYDQTILSRTTYRIGDTKYDVQHSMLIGVGIG